MKRSTFNFEQFFIAKQLLRWIIYVIPVAVSVGVIVAIFLWLLDRVTTFRWNHPWMIFLLPLAGILITWIYRQFGKDAEAGNNLIMDEIHQPGGGVPARMAPLIMVTTLLTHLFGGSAGREGTAVQVGGSIADLFAGWFGMLHADKRILLMGGMAAGFGAVFGTPVTGAIFALEVLAIGRIKYDALLPCLVAAIVADLTCSGCGIHHTAYHISFHADPRSFLPHLSFDVVTMLKVTFAAVLFGLAGFFFANMSHRIGFIANRYIRKKWLIPVAGAILIVGISYLLGSLDYLGLGVTNPGPDNVSIVSAFSLGGATSFSWFWKLLLTAITLGTGFKGGEVTPLFFIGATLGNTLAVLTGAPVDLFAGLGFIAVFAAATNTPLACTIMGVELFGSDHIVYYAIACFIAYYFSGHSGVYRAQRVAVSKWGSTDTPQSIE